MEEGKSAFKILLDKSTGRRPLGRSKGGLEISIRMDLKETCTNTRNWIDSAQDGYYWGFLENAAFNLRVSSSPGVS